jgi:hypothetical protein
MGRVIEEARAAVMPFESWERLTGETGAAYAAFCAYRDMGLERNIRKAVDAYEKNEGKRGKRYRMWRAWAAQFRWRDRAADYDRYLDRLKQTEKRKTIEAQEETHRAVTRKMLEVVGKKLEMMNPADLSAGAVTEWVGTAIRADREAAGLVTADGKPEPKQGEINFTPEFEGPVRKQTQEPACAGEIRGGKDGRMGCKYFDGCSAPLCPKDAGIANRSWFPDEDICRLAAAPDWVRRQQRVAKKAAQGGYFTLAMLKQDCRISRGIKGIDPDGEERERAAWEAAWFKAHPAITAELREKSRAMMLKNKALEPGFGTEKPSSNRGLVAVPEKKGC